MGKLKDLFAVVRVCTRLNGTYAAEFSKPLSKALEKAFGSPPAHDVNRRRFLLRICAELCLVECISAASSPLLKMIQELCDSSASDEQAISNFTVLASLVQKHAVSCLNVVPNKHKTYEEALGKPWVTRNCVLDSALQMQLMRLVIGAYSRSAADVLQGAYNRLRMQEKELKREANAENELKHQQLKDQFEKVQSNLSVLS